MEIGTELTLDAHYGTFMLHNNTQISAVFLTGDIRVTPVRSIVLQATHDNLPHRILLFDSNRRPEDAAFLDALTEAQKKNPNYTFVGTMTEMEKSGWEWHGETRFITKAMLLKYIDDLMLPIYYLAGRPQWWLRCVKHWPKRESTMTISARRSSQATEAGLRVGHEHQDQESV